MKWTRRTDRSEVKWREGEKRREQKEKERGKSKENGREPSPDETAERGRSGAAGRGREARREEKACGNEVASGSNNGGGGDFNALASGTFFKGEVPRGLATNGVTDLMEWRIIGPAVARVCAACWWSSACLSICLWWGIYVFRGRRWGSVFSRGLLIC